MFKYVKEGDHIFINGGSGGSGVFGLQIAKFLGCHVTTTCSMANVELCKSLGVNRVIDCRDENVLDALKSADFKYDHIVDNVGSNSELYRCCHEYSSPSAVYIMVGANSIRDVLIKAKNANLTCIAWWRKEKYHYNLC